MSKVTLTKEQEGVLRAQVIDATHPGTILHDFEQVLHYVGEKGGVKAGGKYNLLPLDAIPILDAQLARPLKLDLERPQLRSHPYLQGLHLLFRATGLGRVDGQGAKARLVVDPNLLRSWRELNPTEQYFALLEAFLLISRSDMVGMRNRWDASVLTEWAYSLPDLVTGKPGRDRNRTLSWFLFRDFDHYFRPALLDLFGLVSVPYLPQRQERRLPSDARMTPFGEAAFTLLAEFLSGEGSDVADFDDEAPDDSPSFGFLQPLFQPYFPQWQKTLAHPAAPEAREGVFVFKVSLSKDVWRLIALAHDQTLHTLMSAILDSIDFDFDHLYVFTYRDHLGRTVKAVHSYCEEGVSAEEVEIGSLPLKPGDSMSLLYDFGDSWRFTVKLERIDPPGSIKKLPKVVEKHGKAPKQYPAWD